MKSLYLETTRPDDYRDRRPYKVEKLNTLWALLIIISAALLYGVAVVRFYSLPKPLDENDPQNRGEFIAARARQDLKKLEELGTRVVGSASNEKQAVELLMKTVNEIKQNASDLYEIENLVQTVSGGLVLGPSASFYDSIHNVVVKFSPRNAVSNSSLLINAHFDTVPTSPGGGDDGLMVAVMLEVLRVLSASKTLLQHTIIFLFNGAEENSLQGSHAFITQHEWAKDIKAFINLDALGNGGKEILFQSGPQHPWIAKYYTQYAVHPYANSMGEEIFQLNLIPSDTDFRIFRDFGHIPGLDLAHCLNDYVYHTEYDGMESISDGTFQHTGDNILAIAKAIANSPELPDTSKHASGNLVFYDVLGWFIIYYSDNTGVIINLSICAVSIAAIIISLALIKHSAEVTYMELVFKLIWSLCVQSASGALATGVVVGIAFLLDSVDYSLSWFSQPWLLFGLYYCPFVFVLGMIPSLYLNSRFNILPLHFAIQLLLHSQCIMFISVAIIMTILQIRSAYVVTIAIMFYTSTVIVNWVVNIYTRPYLWLLPLLIGQILPFAFYGYLSMISNSTFIPLSGRFGADFNAEILIAFSQTGFAMLMAGFLVPIFNLFKRTKIILSFFMLIFIIFFIIAFTSLAFPYTTATAPQRHSVYHTKRTFHAVDGSVRREDAGYYILTWDRRSPGIIKDTLAKHVTLQNADKDCSSELMCGLPHYFSGMRSFVSSGFWVDAKSPNLEGNPTLTLLSKEEINGLQRFTFKMTGTRQTQIFIEPISGVQLINWSLPSKLPSESNKQDDAYFLMMRFGGDSVSKEFWLDFKVPEKNNGSTFNIALVGHYQDRDDKLTTEFKQFLKLFPPYAALVATQSSYERWRF